jgi:hypothetical protein
MAKERETPQHHSVLGISRRFVHLSADVRLGIPCWLLAIEISWSADMSSDYVDLS